MKRTRGVNSSHERRSIASKTLTSFAMNGHPMRNLSP
jgi:hypothetical protein